jgi:hypothetical protein
VQIYVEKKIKLENICRARKKFQKMINVGHFNKTIGPRKKQKLINVSRAYRV